MSDPSEKVILPPMTRDDGERLGGIATVLETLVERGTVPATDFIARDIRYLRKLSRAALEGEGEAGWVTQVEAARRLGVHPNTIAAMLDDGRLRAVEKGNGSGPCGTCRRVDPTSLPVATPPPVPEPVGEDGEAK